MLNKCKKLLLVSSIGAGFLLAACTNPSGDLQGNSGYLSSYEGFVKGSDDGVELIRGKPGIKIGQELSKYSKLMISPIIVWQGGDQTRFQGASEADLKAITDIFHQELVDAVDDGYDVVTEPGPDVLKIEIALTGLIASDPSIDGAIIVVPFMPFLSKTEELVTGKQSFVGATAIEGILRNSVSNDEIAAFVDTKIGHRIYEIKSDEDDLSDPYRYSKISFKWWASRLRYVLDSTRTQ